MNQATTHRGGCHCGKVRYHVDLDLARPVITCNCSICGKTGSLLAFAPAAAFQLDAGDDVLTDYQFASRTIHHLFCKVCGVRSFARGVAPDGAETVAVNVRCLDDVDPGALTLIPYDGKSR